MAVSNTIKRWKCTQNFSKMRVDCRCKQLKNIFSARWSYKNFERCKEINGRLCAKRNH